MRIANRPVPRSRRRGAAAVEFAFVLPLLVLIVLGCIDFGRFAYSYIAITNAARAGAGYGCTHTFTVATFPAWQAKTKQAAADEMSGFDPSLFQIADPLFIPESPTLWQVQVEVSYTFQTFIDWPGIPNQVPMYRKVIMRNVR